MKKLVHVLFIVLYGTTCISAQNSKDAPDKVYTVKTTHLQNLYINLPENYNTSNSYNVLIVLHGFGGDAENLIRPFRSYSKLPIIIAAPQGLYETGAGGYSWYYVTKNKKIWEIADKFSTEYIVEVVKEIKENYDVDDIFIFGFSQGASLASKAGVKNPDLFKGIAAVGGNLPEIEPEGELITDEILNDAKKVKIFASVGSYDQVVKRDSFDKQVKYLEEKGFDVTRFIYEGGHDLTRDLLEQLYLWIKSNSRNFD